MPADSRATTPAELQQLSDEVIRFYRDTAAFCKRANAGDYEAANEEAELELNRLLLLAYTVLIRRNEFLWFRRAHAQNALNGGWATLRASWHDQAAWDAGEILWECLDTPGPRFPPEPGDPPPPPVELGTNWEYLEMGHPPDRWQDYPTRSDQNDGWEVNRMDPNLQAEAALAAQLCAAESKGRNSADTDPIEVTEDFVTIVDIALLAGIEVQSVRNKLFESGKSGAAPKPAKKGTGKKRSKYDYYDILPWLRCTWPSERFPDSSREAAAIISRRATQKSV